MQIEIPRRLIRYVVFTLIAIGPVWIGISSSPSTPNQRPLLLTPRLAQINEYRRSVQAWVRTFQSADADLTLLLDNPSPDLFDQDRQINRIHQAMSQTAAAIDRATVPPTFESLHELLGNTANAFLDADRQMVRWMSEPRDENQQAARAALAAARQLLARLAATPWIAGEP